MRGRDGAMENKVVAHFLDGRVIKGSSFDVSPDKSICHLLTRDRETVTLNLAEVKALFFVKDLEGRPAYHEQQALNPADSRARGAKRLELVFRDGERLTVLAPVYSGTRPLFFVIPVDPQSNNDRILVNRAALDSITLLEPGA